MPPVADDHLAGDDDLVDVGRGRSVGDLISTGARGAHRV
jgi:hypothetical protein